MAYTFKTFRFIILNLKLGSKKSFQGKVLTYPKNTFKALNNIWLEEEAIDLRREGQLPLDLSICSWRKKALQLVCRIGAGKSEFKDLPVLC